MFLVIDKDVKPTRFTAATRKPGSVSEAKESVGDALACRRWSTL